MWLSVHALRLISRIGKRVQRCLCDRRLTMSSETLVIISRRRVTDNRFECPAVCWRAACDTMFTRAAKLGLGKQCEVR